jgi:fibronectin-binding autotransporter adhesin
MRALSRRLLVGVSALALLSSVAYADTQAIDVTSVGTYPPLSNNGFNYYQAPGGYKFSWNFTLNSAIEVTQLGYYDSGLAGTPEPNGFGSHLVTLFDVTTDTTIASATVTATSSASGVFNYAPITPVRLSASDTYTISGDMTDQYYLVGLNKAAAPSASQVNYQFTSNGNIFGSTPPPGAYDDFGPNFQFATAATCTENVPGRNVIALTGDQCRAAGTYNPTTSNATLPVTYNGFGFYANGGTITSSGQVTIDTTDPNSSGRRYGAWADGPGANITLGGPTTITTITTVGASSIAAFASGGGKISSTGPISVSTTGAGAHGLNASGPGSSIVGPLGSVSTSGSFASGAQADAGGALTLTGGTVETLGPNAVGLLATGANSQITANNVAVSTSGASAAGVQSAAGAAISLNLGSVTTNGANSAGVYALGGGTVMATGGTQVTTTGGASIGLRASGAGSAIAFTLGSVSTKGATASGAQADSGGSLTLNGGTVSTLGPSASGLLAMGANSQITASNVAVSTGGAFATGVQSAFGGAISLNSGAVTTVGAAAHAIFVTDAGSTVTLAGTQNLTTSGNGSMGIYAGSGGVATGTGTFNISTSGTNALSSGLSSMGVNADGTGSAITLRSANVSTAGVGAVGLMASDRKNTGVGGVIVVNGPLSVTTKSTFAYDVFASGAGSQIALNGATVLNVGSGSFGLYAMSGGAIATSGLLTINAGLAGFGGGVEADAGSSITLGGESSIKLTGTNLVGLFATGTGVISTKAALGLDAGANRGIVAQGGTVNLGEGATISTSGANNYGVYATGGGVVTATNGLAVTTLGAGAMAVFASGTNSAISATNVAITTSGVSSFGAHANDGGAVALTGGAVNTTGDGAIGLSLVGAGSSLSANGVHVGTTGGVDTATGYHGHAIYNGPGASAASGGNLFLTNVTASTAGLQSSALLTDTGGVTKVTGGALSTTGVSAGAAAVLNSGALTISGATLATSGDGSTALFINGSGGTVTASNLTISTSGGVWTAGDGSHADGVYNGTFGAFGGGGVMNVTDSAVRTTGARSEGVSVGFGGTTTFLGGSVGTSGVDAHAASATRGGSLTIGLDAAGTGADLRTSGTGAYVVSASGRGIVSLTGATLGATGNGSGGLAVNGAGSEIDATNVRLTTSGGFDPASGLHAYGAANTPFGTFTTGGTLKLAGTQVSTSGVGMYGVYTGASSTTTISGGSVSTFGAGAHALYATGAGANVTASGATLNVYGANAYGAHVASGALLALNDGMRLQAFGSRGGGVYVTGAGSTATLSGTVGISSQAGGSALWADTGGAISTSGVLGVQAAGTGITVNGGPQGGSVSATGALDIKAASPTNPAILLSGDNASFSGKGGGVIEAAGPVVEFLNGANQSASFTGYTIVGTGGDLVFADPSSSTLNFNNTTAATAGNLVNATNASTVTLNANASSLTGAVATDATSTTNFNLTNGSSLLLTGNSTITNLNLNNSALGFTPSTTGGFSTLTVTNYTGTGGALTLNAALGGPTPGADQIIVNRGRATGTTLLTIRSVGAFASSTSGAGLPLVVATNGGAIAPGAFALSGPLVVNGFAYSLKEQDGGDFLISNTTQTASQGAASLASLSQARQTQTITTKLLGSILTGATEQINCSSCSSGFASFGSLALGLHGRWTLNDNFAVLAGASYDSFSSQGVSVNNSMQVALALRYDAVQLGKNRPFVEAGLTAQPWASVTYRRAYDSALGGGVGVGTTLSRSVAAYGRVGYIWRLSRADEAAVYGDLTRSWDYTGGYTESASPGNPNGATVAPTLDMLNVARLGAQYTHLFGQHIEGNLSGGFAQAFGAAYGTSAALGGLGVDTGSAATGFHWWELGARVSYRFSKSITADLFGIGTLGAQPVGNQIHGGLALRMAF